MRSRRPKIKSDYSRSAIAKRWVLLLLPTRLSVFLFRTFIDNNRERNALEAQKFLVDANKIYPTRLYSLLPKFLSFSFRLGCQSVSEQYLASIKGSLMSTRRDPSQRSRINSLTYQLTKQLEVQTMTAQSWKLLSLALGGFGLIRASTVARENCLSKALIEVEGGTASRRTIELAMRGLLEKQQLDKYKALQKNLSEDVTQITAPPSHEIYMNLMSSKDFVQLGPAVKTRSSELDLFDEAVRDRVIALVATGELSNNYGMMIDQSDSVARTKFQGSATSSEPEKSGSRCDISFYTQDLIDKFKLKSHCDPSDLNFLNSVKVVVAKTPTDFSFNSVAVRVIPERAPVYLTTATSGTLFLFDLLAAGPRKIKLYGFNFYSERNLYDSALLDFYSTPGAYQGIGLPKNWFDLSTHQRASATIARGFIPHDPKSDFLFVKNLYELSGLIDGTPEVLEILNLTADEYDMRLEEMLGDW